MNILYVISSQSAYGLAIRIIVASSIEEAINMKDDYYPESLKDLGWDGEYDIMYSHPTTDSKGIKIES